MNRKLSLFLLILTVLCVLSACSDDSSDIDPADEVTTQNSYYDPTDASEAFPKNWRPGTVAMTLKISQYGDQVTETDAQGGTKITAKWDFNLNAQQQFKVMLPPDFTQVFPDYSAARIDPMTLEELLFIPLNEAEIQTEGNVAYSGEMETRTPRSNEVVFQSTRVSASSDLSTMSLDALRVSSVGKGFEADLRFSYKMAGNIRSSTRYLSGAKEEFDAECCETEEEYPRFFPPPDINVARRVNYPSDANMPAEIAETSRQLRLDLVAALERITNNVEPRANLHPGMQWTAEPNTLKLRYHSETPNLVSQGHMLAMAAPASQRLYSLEIVLTAD